MSYGLGVKIHRYRITKFNSASCSCLIYPLYRRKKRRDDCNKNMLLSIKFDILRIRKHSETSRYLQKKCENTGSFSCIFIVIKSKEKWL